jgi:ABC-2 type transport system permease protein
MIVSQYIKVRLQYRGDFIIGSLGILFKNISGLFTFWILFKSISNIEGWSYDELVFIYAFSLLSITPKQIFFVIYGDCLNT